MALEVITKEIDWRQAIDNDWRNTKAWKPGWIYTVFENLKFEKNSIF